MRTTDLTFLALNLNSALDSGRYNKLSHETVIRCIEAGTIFTFLEDTLDDDIDLSILNDQTRSELIEEWQGFLDAINARRKFGVENNGLHLLIACLLQGIQQQRNINPKVMA